LNIKLTYSRIKAADERCDEIVKELATLPPMEYCPEESRLKTRELNGEFIRSATFIVNQCQYVLNSDKFNDIDFHIKMEKFQNRYERILESIS